FIAASWAVFRSVEPRSCLPSFVVVNQAAKGDSATVVRCSRAFCTTSTRAASGGARRRASSRGGPACATEAERATARATATNRGAREGGVIAASRFRLPGSADRPDIAEQLG